ncbi:MAG TPA: SDR family oxidoreductase [Gemmatimonadales bacterium]|nr:SDR family oxidoreductase [Gemmatimonadales bacterium]
MPRLALWAAAAWVASRWLRDDGWPTLAGRTVLVTGGSRGLGLVLAREAAADGARIAICGRDAEALERAGEALRRIGAEVLTIECDVTDPAAVRRMVEEVAQRLGPVDMLINNAGVIEVGPVETMAVADYAEAMATNFWGVLFPILEVLPAMRARGDGRIVNITSIGGKLGVPHLVPYSASKFAAMGLSQGLRAELAADGVAVTAAVPGLMRTGSPRNAIFRGRHRAEYAWFSIVDSLPGLTVSAETAATRILAAARRGDAEVLFPVAARAVAIAQAAVPNLMARVLAGVNRMLPRAPSRRTGRRRGAESQSPLSPSLLTRLGDRAAHQYNQLAPEEGHTT